MELPEGMEQRQDTERLLVVMVPQRGTVGRHMAAGDTDSTERVGVAVVDRVSGNLTAGR